jgi:hypothetical protein
MEVPCPAGCGGHWKHPRAESFRVIDGSDAVPARPEGNVAQTNRIGADFIRAALERWGFVPPDPHHPKG